MDLNQHILVDLFTIFIAAKIGAWLFAWLGQPQVLGELLAGVVIGPHSLGFIGRPDQELIVALGGEEAARAALEGAYWSMAELGLVFLLFFVGLETRIQEIFKVGRHAAAVAILGVLLPFALGYGYMHFMQWPGIEAVFIGAALVATSTGITARALRDLGVIRSTEARIILGAAVIDDVLSLTIIALLSGLGGADRSTPLDLVLFTGEILIFIAFVALVGTGLVRRYGPRLRATPDANVPFILAISICLGLAVLAGQIGLSPIVGAFLAGMILAEARGHFDIELSALPVYELLVPFFFVVVGAEVDLALFTDPRILGFTLVLTILAIIGKFVGCAIGSWGLGWRAAAIIGVGMVPRGEVGLVVVSLGRSLNVLADEIFSAIVVMSFLTTIIVPPFLARLFAGPRLAMITEAGPGDMRQAGHLPGLGVTHEDATSRTAEGIDR